MVMLRCKPSLCEPYLHHTADNTYEENGHQGYCRLLEHLSQNFQSYNKAAVSQEARDSTAPTYASAQLQVLVPVRIAFPEFGFGSVSSLPGSDPDRFSRAGFGFGSVSQGRVRIRIGFAWPGPDSDRLWKR